MPTPEELRLYGQKHKAALRIIELLEPTRRISPVRLEKADMDKLLQMGKAARALHELIKPYAW